MATFYKFIAIVASAVIVAGCNTMTSTDRISMDGGERWALLPVNNLSTTPLAGEQAKNMIEINLRTRGVAQVDAYAPNQELTLAALLDNGQQYENSISWAKDQGFRYAVTGTVHEWHYKSGPDKEPAVGLSLKVLDLQSGQVVWQGSGARTGWGYANLSSVANKVVSDLLKKVSVKRGVSRGDRVAQVPVNRLGAVANSVLP